METLSKEQLIKIIEEQSTVIRSLTNEREWLFNENYQQGRRCVEYQEKIIRWERYAEIKRNEMEEIRKAMPRAVEELQALKIKYKNLKIQYFSLLEKYKYRKGQLEYGLSLGRAMYQESQYYKESYAALLQWIYTWNAAAPAAAAETSQGAQIWELEDTNENLGAALLPAAVPVPRNTSSTPPPEVPVDNINNHPGLHCVENTNENLGAALLPAEVAVLNNKSSSPRPKVPFDIINNQQALHCPVILVHANLILPLLRMPISPQSAVCCVLPSVCKERPASVFKVSKSSEPRTSPRKERLASDFDTQKVEKLSESRSVPHSSGRASPAIQGKPAKKVSIENSKMSRYSS